MPTIEQISNQANDNSHGRGTEYRSNDILERDVASIRQALEIAALALTRRSGLPTPIVDDIVQEALFKLWEEHREPQFWKSLRREEFGTERYDEAMYCVKKAAR